MRIDGEVDRARLVVFVENLVPRFAAVGRAKNTALWIRPVCMTECRDEYVIGIVWIDPNPRNVLRVLQSDVLPRLATVGCFVHFVAIGNISAQAGLARPDVDDVGIRFRYRNRTNRCNDTLVGNWLPAHPAIRRTPHAASDRAEVKRIGIARNSGHRQHAAAAIRTDIAPFHPFEL